MLPKSEGFIAKLEKKYDEAVQVQELAYAVHVKCRIVSITMLSCTVSGLDMGWIRLCPSIAGAWPMASAPNGCCLALRGHWVLAAFHKGLGRAELMRQPHNAHSHGPQDIYSP